MAKGGTLSELGARRQLFFLGTFDKKLQILRRELERLQRAASESGMPGGQRSLNEVDRVVRGLVGAGPVYGVENITAWAKETLTRVEAIRQTNAPPTEEDLAWLASEIQELGRLREEAAETAKEDLARGGKARTLRKPSSIPPPLPKSAQMGGAPAQAASDQEGRGQNGGAVIQMMPVLALVVAETDSVRKKVVSALSGSGFSVRELSSDESAIEVIQEESPDLVVIDVDDPAPGGGALVDLMSRDPLTDFVPVLRLATSMASPYSNAIPKPLDPERLVAEAGKLIGQEIEIGLDNKGLKDLTLEELTEFVSSEIRAGVLDAATGSDVRKSFQIVEKGPLIASIWALIARLRRVAAEGSGGKIRFVPTTHGPIGMMALDEAEAVLDPASREIVNETDLAALSGLSAVVADDDVEIRAVFDKVLSDAGMKVRTATNGKEASTFIHESPPDVLITDILMPEMDGWELATRLRWDFALRHIPIIMLSWKEDFLQRVRELNAEADDYMLKEVDRRQILSRVAGVLKPRFTFEQRLVDEGEVTGRVERAGVVTILKAAMEIRPDCRITLRENWNYFEANIIGGELASVNRTGTDGSFASGMPALERLIGVSSGRFSVVQAVDVSKKQFSDGTSNAIRQATDRLNSLNNQVVDGALINIAKIEMNGEVIEVYSKVLPPKLKTLVRQLVQGKLPKDLILNAYASTETLETLLLDLIRMGAVQGIVGAEKRTGRLGDHAKPDLISAPPSFDIDMGDAANRIDGESKRDASATIPLTLDEVSEMVSIPSGGPIPMLGEPAPARQKQSKTWQIFAVVFFACFVATAVFHFLTTSEEPQRPADSESTPSTAPKIAEQGESEPAPAPAAGRADSKSASEAEKDDKESPPDDALREKEPIETPKVEESEGERKDKRSSNRSEEKETREKKSKKSEEPSRQSEKEKLAPPTPTGPTGLLSILAPREAPGPIKVSVDGSARGNAPLKVRLGPGLHEIVFSFEGKRSIKMVSIKANEIKNMETIVPK
jgi:CheY-like chemotaxis protein